MRITKIQNFLDAAELAKAMPGGPRIIARAVKNCELNPNAHLRSDGRKFSLLEEPRAIWLGVCETR